MTELPNGLDVSELAWPEETDVLRYLMRQGWAMYAFGRRTQPDALAAVKKTEHHADVIVMWGHDRAAAYRTPETSDPLNASMVTWHYLGAPVSTMLAALRLVFTDEPSYPIPAACRIPETAWQRFTVRVGRTNLDHNGG
jgi:hypothetical protein